MAVEPPYPPSPGGAHLISPGCAGPGSAWRMMCVGGDKMWQVWGLLAVGACKCARVERALAATQARISQRLAACSHLQSVK